MSYWERLGRTLGLLVMVATLSAASAGGGLVPPPPISTLGDGALASQDGTRPLSLSPHRDVTSPLASSTGDSSSGPSATAAGEAASEAVSEAASGGAASSETPADDASGHGLVLLPDPTIHTHLVAPGETLSEIADRYGVTVQTIAQCSGLSNPNRISPGQSLTFPSVDGLLHRVKPGDTLSGLAQRYGAQAPEIAWANRITDPRALEVGSLLIVPGGRMPQVTVASGAASGPASGSGVLAWPLRGPITSYYGPRGGGQHTGIDIAGDYGASIRAAAGGEVTMAAWYGRYGRTVIIDHGGGLSTLYAHASEMLVTVGQQVVGGEIIARVGSTGNSTGPHLHFEVRVGDQFRNPLSYLPPSP